MKFQLRLTGSEEIDRVLRGLPLQLNHKILQEAHAAAAKPLVEAERLTAPEGPTGNLIDSIGIIKTGLKNSNALGQIVIGPRRGGKYKGHTAHLVEYGTRKRNLKNGANRGVMPAKPFAEPSWERTRGVVQDKIADFIGVKLFAFMKRTLKK